MPRRRTTKQQPRSLHRWQIETRDGYTFCAVGVLEVTPRRTALVWHDGDGGRSHLVFGAVSKLIKSIEAIEDQNGQQ
jgi:hypothetical protein